MNQIESDDRVMASSRVIDVDGLARTAAAIKTYSKSDNFVLDAMHVNTRRRRSGSCRWPETKQILNLRKYVVYYVRFFGARQSLTEALVRECQSRVIDSQAMKDRGVHIAYVDRIFNNVVAKVIRLTMDDAASNPTAGHPN